MDRPAHLGCCVARHEGRVVFVRHALPGERVRVRVTEDRGGSFLRADAIRVLEAAPQRQPPPCPQAGPGRCGGCDWQHAHPAAQREIKATVVRELLERIGGLSVPSLRVEEVPGGPLGWRTRAQFARDRAGRPGLRRHRSHTVQPLVDCPLLAPPLRAALVEAAAAPAPGGGLDLACSSTGEVAVTARTGRHRDAGMTLHERAVGRTFRVHAGGFWQVHPVAAATLVEAVLAMVAPRPGERALDLYAGAGLFTAALATAVGPTGSVRGVETDPVAAADGAANLADLPQATLEPGVVQAWLAAHEQPADVVVLDPPRAGAGAGVMQALAARGARAIGYVSCDPATLAADLRVAVGAGLRLRSVRAFDLFPMTHHCECVALLEPADQRAQ